MVRLRLLKKYKHPADSAVRSTIGVIGFGSGEDGGSESSRLGGGNEGGSFVFPKELVIRALGGDDGCMGGASVEKADDIGRLGGSGQDQIAGGEEIGPMGVGGGEVNHIGAVPVELPIAEADPVSECGRAGNEQS